MKFHSVDVIAAIQHVLDKRFKTLKNNCGMSQRDAYEKVYREFERSLADSIRKAAHDIWVEDGLKRTAPGRKKT
jgi:hypothetical protein